jgi:hypothetical protein
VAGKALRMRMLPHVTRLHGHGLGSFARALLLASSFVMQACDAGITVRGVVLDDDRQPIVGADYFLEDRLGGAQVASHGYTDDQGRFETSPTQGNIEHDYWIRIEAAGYRTHEERIWRGDGVPEDVIEVEIALTLE